MCWVCFRVSVLLTSLQIAMPIIKTQLPLTLYDIHYLNEYIRHVEAVTFYQKDNDYCENPKKALPLTIGFLKYRQIMSPTFKLIKMGGSSQPRIEFAIIKTASNKRLKLVKFVPNQKGNRGVIYKLIFPDSSYYESKFGHGQFMMHKIVEDVEYLTVKYGRMKLEETANKQNQFFDRPLSRQSSVSFDSSVSYGSSCQSPMLSPVTSIDTYNDRLEVLSLNGKEDDYGTCSSAKTIVIDFSLT